MYADAAQGRPIQTIFFGGGTPSLLEGAHLERIFTAARRAFAINPDVEITLEANPESVTPAKAAAWRTAGVNRLSLGLQAMDDELLKAMGRLHDTAQFKKAYADARATGFENVNVDLIYGFPQQTLASWQRTVVETAALEPDHLSLYSLTVEEHTPFASAGVRVDTDVQASMYEWARVFLKEAGYDQYEISNFARPGRACRHNLIYWRQNDYLGLGVGAVGCLGDLRWQNVKALEPYAQMISKLQKPRHSEERLDEQTRKFERLMLGLRLREGLQWGNETDPRWARERTRLASEGLLEPLSDDRWRIPEAAIIFTNQVLLPFVDTTA